MVITDIITAVIDDITVITVIIITTITTRRDVVWGHSSRNMPNFFPTMGYPPIINSSLQKTSTSKPKLKSFKENKKR